MPRPMEVVSVTTRWVQERRWLVCVAAYEMKDWGWLISWWLLGWKECLWYCRYLRKAPNAKVLYPGRMTLRSRTAKGSSMTLRITTGTVSSWRTNSLGWYLSPWRCRRPILQSWTQWRKTSRCFDNKVEILSWNASGIGETKENLEVEA